MNNGPSVNSRDDLIQDGDFKIAVNSIQRTLHVERLYVNIARANDIYLPFDIDNLYPQKVKSIAKRSGTTMSAWQTLSSFISGDGITGMDQIINSDGQTFWDILRHICNSKSLNKGWALHFNYNLFGQIVEINPINFESVRWHRDLKHFVVNPDWFRRQMRRKDEKVYNPFDPSNVLNEMQSCGGYQNYLGQIFYWIPNKSDWYTECNFDEVLDDAQFEAEVKLYSLSSIQNDYSLSGFLTYPKALTDVTEIELIKKDLRQDKGSANAGGIRVVSATPSENLTNWKWFNPISRNNIDSLHKQQKEDAKFNIYAAFRQPPILNGVVTGGMFNQESFADAFNYYNAATETERKEVERELTKIISFSIWSGMGKLQIMPKTFNLRDVNSISTTPIIPTPQTTKPVQSELNDTLTNLTGRQLQGVFRITRKYKKGELTFDQAALMLSTGFGFDPNQIKIWLVNDDEEI